MKHPSPRQLQYFLAVVDTLSFVRAAELCHVTQSTLSNGLAELKSIFGEKLFDRGTRSVSLTRVGKDLELPARDILARLENMALMAKQYREPLTSRLVLGIIPTIAPYLLPKILPNQQKHYPDMDLQIKEDVTARQLDDLDKGLVDAVLMAFPYEIDDHRFERVMLWKEPFFLAGQHLPGDGHYQMSITDLKNYPILLLEDGHCLRDQVISACRLTPKADSHRFNRSLGATSLQTLVQMVQHGYGATMLPSMAIDTRNFPKGLEIRRFKNPQPYREIGLVWRRHDPREKEFKLLGEFIHKIR